VLSHIFLRVFTTKLPKKTDHGKSEQAGTDLKRSCEDRVHREELFQPCASVMAQRNK